MRIEPMWIDPMWIDPMRIDPMRIDPMRIDPMWIDPDTDRPDVDRPDADRPDTDIEPIRIEPDTDIEPLRVRPAPPLPLRYDSDGRVAPTSRSRPRRSRQSGIADARCDQNAGEWFGTARCAISCATT